MGIGHITSILLTLVPFWALEHELPYDELASLAYYRKEMLIQNSLSLSLSIFSPLTYESLPET